MYREPPARPPLVITTDRLAQAFDSATGKPLWTKELRDTSGYARVATSGSVLVLAVGRKVLIIEIATGRALLETELWFTVRTAVAEDDVVVLSGEKGLACFDRNGYVWGIRGAKDAHWVENARGEKIADLDRFAHAGSTHSDLGMALGRAVFQPDHNT